jgi:hypothetical protein
MAEAGTKAVRSSQGYVILLNKTQGIWWLEVTTMRVPLIGGRTLYGPTIGAQCRAFLGVVCRGHPPFSSYYQSDCQTMRSRTTLPSVDLLVLLLRGPCYEVSVHSGCSISNNTSSPDERAKRGYRVTTSSMTNKESKRPTRPMLAHRTRRILHLYAPYTPCGNSRGSHNSAGGSGGHAVAEI